MMARASHLPQLTANALASVLRAYGLDPGHMGPGGRDTTRLAMSSPSMWRDLLEHAAPELGEGLRALSAEAARIAELVEAGDLDALERLMGATREWRLD